LAPSQIIQKNKIKISTTVNITQQLLPNTTLSSLTPFKPAASALPTQQFLALVLGGAAIGAVNTSGKAGVQIPHLLLGDDSSPRVG
jgi:hypothetical protein